ncbi:hypothetical protein QBC45DRAFT_215839 [Copromyces sp. CBS 386.78]|nr:hypothetical protein QBC45DRAFT_215839 [Copromyces sp. CBS 386.78]
MFNMAFRPKPTDAMDEVVDLRPQTTQQSGPAQKPDMRFDLSTFGNSDLASKLPGFLEEMARANRATQELAAANPKAARIEIDDEEEVDQPVIEMNLYSGVLESEEPKKEILMPNGQPFAGDGVIDGDAEPFISEPVEVRHTTTTTTNEYDRKRRVSASSSSSYFSSSSSSSEGETRIIKISIVERDDAREGSPDSQASADSKESESLSSSKGSPTKIPRGPNGEPEQLIAKLHKSPSPPPRSKSGSDAPALGTSSREATLATTTRTAALKGRSSPSSAAQGQNVQDWVNDQPSMTGDYTEIAGAPNRKMLVPLSRLGRKQSQKNVQDWVNSQSGQSGSTGGSSGKGGGYPEGYEKRGEN